MTNPKSLPALPAGPAEPIDLTLSYGKKPIRARIEAGSLWCAATDVYAALRMYTDRRTLATFDIAHLALVSFPAPSGGRINLTAITPLGVATIATTLAPPMNRILASWARKQANQLADEHGIRRLEMTLLADGTLPPKPRVLDDNYQPWLELQRRNPTLYKWPVELDDPALDDEDTNVAPPPPAAALALLQSLSAAGARA
jgi:hypothetical protein